MKEFSIVSLLILCTLVVGSQAQYFDPILDDRTYLDNIQRDIASEVDETKTELKEQARMVEDVTKNFIGAKLKENLFIALRVLAEKELNSISVQERKRQPRQEDEDSETPEGTTRRNQVIPQVAGLIKAIFGGNINLTSYVESATYLLPKPVQKQVIGFVKILATNPADKYTTIAPNVTRNATTTTTTTATTTTTTTTQAPTTVLVTEVTERATSPNEDEDEDEDEDNEEDAGSSDNERKLRQLPGLPNLLPNHHPITHILNTLGNIVGGNNAQSASQSKSVTLNVVGATTESVSGFEEEKAVTATPTASAPASQGVNLSSLTEGLRNGLGDLIKVMPDIFQGAREAYKLLGTVTGLFQRLDAE